MVVVAQLVVASDCGSEGRGFEPLQPPFFNFLVESFPFFAVAEIVVHYRGKRTTILPITEERYGKMIHFDIFAACFSGT